MQFIKKTLCYGLLLAAAYFITYHAAYTILTYKKQGITLTAFTYHLTEHEPYIEGSPDFQEDVKKALVIINEASPEQYADISKYCIQVKLVDGSTTHPLAAWSTKNGSLQVYSNWYQECKKNNHEYYMERMLVHETAHFIQYADNQWDDDAVQREAGALAAERKLLTALNVSPKIIETVAGEHLLETRWWEDNIVEVSSP